jgi:hypothetical protein
MFPAIIGRWVTAKIEIVTMFTRLPNPSVSELLRDGGMNARLFSSGMQDLLLLVPHRMMC